MARLTPEQIDGHKVIQLAFVVDDLRQSALQWTKVGAGPFFVQEEQLPITNVKDVNGAPGFYDHSVAHGQWGPVMIELIKPHRIGPETIVDPMGKLGFNHMAYFTDDPEAEADQLTKAGAPIIVSMDFGGDNPIHFHDGRETHGFVIEHYAYSGLIEFFYSKVAEAAVDWDGTDPVRGPLDFSSL